jgi:hypothetical protein
MAYTKECALLVYYLNTDNFIMQFFIHYSQLMIREHDRWARLL